MSENIAVDLLDRELSDDVNTDDDYLCKLGVVSSCKRMKWPCCETINVKPSGSRGARI